MRRRAVGLFFICGAMVPLAIVSSAWACGVLVTLQVSPGSVTPGQTGVVATGENYARNTCVNEPPTCNPATSASPVVLRWNSRRGPIVGQDATVQSNGRLDTTITIPPSAKAGTNLVLALQNTASGVPKSGTPGRTRVRVAATRGAVRQRSEDGRALPAAWGPSKPAGPGGAAAVVTLDGAEPATPALVPTLLGGLLSAGLLGTGLTLVRRSRSTAKPALGA